ncbi:MAG TPA: hypothetical protein VF502_08435 [Stellaceae bacterium]
MPTARQRASLDTHVLEANGDAADPTASARLAGMLQRLEALRQAAPPPSAAPATRHPTPQAMASTPVAIAAANGADDLFYDKGAATAASFRPWYWSYERQAEAPQDGAAAPPADAATAPAPVEMETAPPAAAGENAGPKP